MVESAGKIFGWLIIITKLPNYQSWLIIITKLPNFLSIVWHTVFHFLYWNTVHCKMWQVWEGGDGEKNSFPRLTCFISLYSALFWCWGQEVFCSLSLPCLWLEMSGLCGHCGLILSQFAEADHNRDEGPNGYKDGQEWASLVLWVGVGCPGPTRVPPFRSRLLQVFFYILILLALTWWYLRKCFSN